MAKPISKHPLYLKFISEQPCCACERVGHKQVLRSEVAHVGERGLRQKCSDLETIPLCPFHHRTGPTAQHKIGKEFWIRYGIDRAREFERLQKMFYSHTEEAV